MDENRENTILVVTEDKSIRDYVKSIHGKSSYRVILVTNIKEFFDTLLNEDIDLIIYDQDVNSLNGIDAFSVAKSYHPKIPAILIFEKENFETTRSILDKGVIYRMIKPFNKKDFEQVCENVLVHDLHQSNKRYSDF